MSLYGQADCKCWPPSHPYKSAFCDFFGVRMTLDYGYRCSETQGKISFHPTTNIPNSFLWKASKKLVGDSFPNFIHSDLNIPFAMN